MTWPVYLETKPLPPRNFPHSKARLPVPCGCRVSQAGTQKHGSERLGLSLKCARVCLHSHSMWDPCHQIGTGLLPFPIIRRQGRPGPSQGACCSASRMYGWALPQPWASSKLERLCLGFWPWGSQLGFWTWGLIWWSQACLSWLPELLRKT